MQEEEGRWEFGWGVLPAGGCPLVHLSVLGDAMALRAVPALLRGAEQWLVLVVP